MHWVWGRPDLGRLRARLVEVVDARRRDIDNGSSRGLVGAENLCHQAIFMNHAPCAVMPLDP